MDRLPFIRRKMEYYAWTHATTTIWGKEKHTQIGEFHCRRVNYCSNYAMRICREHRKIINKYYSPLLCLSFGPVDFILDALYAVQQREKKNNVLWRCIFSLPCLFRTLSCAAIDWMVIFFIYIYILVVVLCCRFCYFLVARTNTTIGPYWSSFSPKSHTLCQLGTTQRGPARQLLYLLIWFTQTHVHDVWFWDTGEWAKRNQRNQYQFKMVRVYSGRATFVAICSSCSRFFFLTYGSAR